MRQEEGASGAGVGVRPVLAGGRTVPEQTPTASRSHSQTARPSSEVVPAGTNFSGVMQGDRPQVPSGVPAR